MPRIAPLVLLLSAASAACGERVADFAPEVRAATADVCVIGTVTEIEKEPVQAKPYPGAADTVPFTVAVVKVETNILGAKNVTHVRVGFIPQAGRRRYPEAELKLDQKAVLFLNKHPDAALYTMTMMSPPLDVADGNKQIVARIKQMGTVFADPMAALKAGKAEDRTFAAVVLLVKYRHHRSTGVPQTEEAIPAEESKAILAALADANWTLGEALSVPVVVQQAGLTSANGFRAVAPKPGQDANLLVRDEFKRWAANEGAKYTIKKIVPKTK